MDVTALREDFPLLRAGAPRPKSGRPLVYLDNACMTMKPTAVIDALVEYYTRFPACGGRSVHTLSNQVTVRMEEARAKFRRFIGAREDREIVMTRNTTESINLVAHAFPFQPGDRVLTTDHEHNSNLVPWQIMAQQKGIRHEVVRSGPDNRFDLERFQEMMGRDVKLVSLCHVANLDGSAVPAREAIRIAHDFGAQVLLDGAQSAPHMPVDVAALDVDYFAFSVHKCCGPTGVGVLYGKFDLLKRLGPFIVGGNTVERTTYDGAILVDPPYRYEAGLQDYAGIHAGGVALDYLERIGRERIREHEHRLNRIMTDRLRQIGRVRIIGPPDPAERAGVCAFHVDRMDPHEIALILDETENIAVRSGMHCVHSWFLDRKVNGSVRASGFLYNTEDEVRFFAEKVAEVIDRFG